MGKVNPDRLREVASEIRKAKKEIEGIASLSLEQFLADSKAINSVKYLLIVVTEGAIDICNHIAAKEGGRCPEDYADCFSVLREEGVIREELAAKLAQMAKFRNLLVHLYWKVDDSRVYRIARESLDDVDEFLKAVFHHFFG
ncbi:MAG: DUF86 domain-containing protein [Armatimonadetes bacterium]|nr:DUF86 domain-containing protein [Armatimonadota bacterium]